ncbi:MAG: TonB-dependent receptor [Saprospiraceae bacterium]
MHRIILNCLLFTFIPVFAFSSGIKGKVVDAYINEGIEGATIYIRELNRGTSTSADGTYLLDNIPQGVYTLLIQYVGYNDVEKRVKLGPLEIVEVDIKLSPSIVVLGEVKVASNHIENSEKSARLSEKNAVQVINVISAEKIEALPDLNVADVLQRVSGVSMTKNSFGSNSNLIIRGMPTRYNSALVDGTILTSTSSSGRSANLDIISAELVGRIEVIKALTPDLEADGIGGTVNIKMKETPDSAFLKVLGGIGYNQYYYNHNFLTFDNSTVAKKDFSALNGPDYLADESEFPRNNLVAETKKALPDLNLGLSGGHRYFNKKFGALFGLSYQSNSLANTYDYTSYVPAIKTGKPSAEYVENQVYSKNQKRIGGFIKLDYQFNPKNQIRIYSSLLQQNELRVREYADHQVENGGQFVRPIATQTETDNSGIWSNSIRGQHILRHNLNIEWTLLFDRAQSQSPDFAIVELAQGGSNPPTLNYTRPVVRNWQWDTDENKSAYLNIFYKPIVLNHLFELKAGGMYRKKFRQNYANEYFFQPYDDNSDLNYKYYPDPNLLTVPLRNNQNDQEKKGNAYLNPGNYRARENMTSFYGMVTTSFGKLQVLTGLRYESYYLHTDHNQNNIQIPIAKTTKQNYDFFPSFHLTYKLTENQNCRFSYYRAINRPNYTEVIPYSDPRAGGQSGNPDLKPAYANCLDLRYEIYPDLEDVFTVGVFYKQIDNAIEEILNKSDNAQPNNVASSTTNFGFELVASKNFGRLNISTNYTYTHSSIDDKAIDFIYQDSILIGNPTVDYNRTLVGQSPHLFNASISYGLPHAGLKSSLTYTLQGDNLSALNNSHLHFNRYQATHHNLGLTIEKRIGSSCFITFKASNLLNSPITWYMKEENDTLIRKAYNYQVYLIEVKYSL